jgi:Yip1 domain
MNRPNPATPLGVRHALLMYTSPTRVFARLEDTGAYGWALATLIWLVTLIGYAQIQTGLIDRNVAIQTEANLAELEKAQGDLLERSELRVRMEAIHKQAEFNRMITRLGVVIATPLEYVVSFLLISAVLYAVVALTGRKPEYHTLMSICVFAGFIQLAGYALRLGMMLHYKTTDVDTTLGALGVPGKASVLAAIDPFHIWFWVLVAIGLTVTQQLSRKMAIGMCVALYLLSFGIRVGLEFASAIALT